MAGHVTAASFWVWSHLTAVPTRDAGCLHHQPTISREEATAPTRISSVFLVHWTHVHRFLAEHTRTSAGPMCVERNGLVKRDRGLPTATATWISHLLPLRVTFPVKTHQTLNSSLLSSHTADCTNPTCLLLSPLAQRSPCPLLPLYSATLILSVFVLFFKSRSLESIFHSKHTPGILSLCTQLSLNIVDIISLWLSASAC